MTAIVRTPFRVNVVRRFIEAFDGNDNTLYMGIGRSYPWNHVSGDDEISTPYNNLNGENADWEDMMTLKRITTSEMSHGIKNVKWEANTKYDAFRPDWTGDPLTGKLKARANLSNPQAGDRPYDLSESDYYVITSDTNVWICISNNPDSDGVPGLSTVAPDLGTDVVDAGLSASYPASASLKRCSDGYVWKKVCTVSNDEVIKFATFEYFPVKTATVAGAQKTLQDNSLNNKGGIFEIIVTNTGLLDSNIAAGSYLIQNAEAGTENVNGTGTAILKIKGNGTGLKYIVDVINSSGKKVSKIRVVDPGSGYTFARPEVVGGGTIAPTLEFLYTPLRGLGVDPVMDLSAFNFIAYAKWALDGGGTQDAPVDKKEITVQNDYRKVSLIANPKLLAGGSVATDNYIEMMYYATCTSHTFIEDDILEYDGGNGIVRGRIIDGDATHFRFVKTRTENNEGTANAALPASAPNTAFGTGAGYADSTNTRSATNVTSVDSPEVIPGSGDIIYTNYRAAIQRSVGLTEEIKIVVEF